MLTRATGEGQIRCANLNKWRGKKKSFACAPKTAETIDAKVNERHRRDSRRNQQDKCDQTGDGWNTKRDMMCEAQEACAWMEIELWPAPDPIAAWFLISPGKVNGFKLILFGVVITNAKMPRRTRIYVGATVEVEVLFFSLERICKSINYGDVALFPNAAPSCNNLSTEKKRIDYKHTIGDLLVRWVIARA